MGQDVAVNGLKYECGGIVHDAGPIVEYGGRTTACMYTWQMRFFGDNLLPRSLATPTTCVRCLCAKPGHRGC
jgi:hypothetical protein